MQDIYRIYHNDIGIAFQWKRDLQQGNSKVIQIVFRRTGFYLTIDEIKDFYNKIKVSKAFKQCKCCDATHNCDNVLLQTPSDKIDMAVSRKELELIEDLIKGTLFQIELDTYLKDMCVN